MNFRTFLDVNGILYGNRNKSNSFELPDSQRIFRSTRFGHHAFDVDQKFLMIMPVGNTRNERSAPSRARVPAAVHCKEDRGESALRGMPVRSLTGRIMQVLIGCKAQAASFFW